MLIPIEIDSSDITSQFDITGEQIQSMFDNIAKSLAMVYYSKLEQEASNELHSTRQRYLQNIKLVDTGKLEGTVLLDYSKDKLIQMLEEGASPFDLKLHLLNSAKVKFTKNGKKFITVPLRWTTGIEQGNISSSKMPDEIYKEARKLDIKESLKLDNIPSQFQTKKTRPEIKDSAGKILFDAYTHKSPIYEGITKMQDNVTGQNTYMSFRRVSELSNKNAFIHPGLVARKLMGKALEKMNLEDELGVQIDNELKKLGFQP